MCKTDQPRVQALPAEAGHAVFRSVDRVARHGMPDVRHVDADLMRAAGFQPQRRVGKRTVIFQYRIVRHCRTGMPVGHAHLLAVLFAAADGRADRPLRLPQMPVQHSSVFSSEGMSLDLLCQGMMRGVRLGDDQEPARILVDPVHDAGTHIAVDAGKAPAAVMQQGVDQRPVRVPRRRMHNHPARLVDHKKVLVLETHVQRDILRRRFDRTKLRLSDADACIRRKLIAFGQGAPSGVDPALTQHFLDERPRPFRLERAEQLVCAHIGQVLGHDELSHCAASSPASSGLARFPLRESSASHAISRNAPTVISISAKLNTAKSTNSSSM